MKVVQRDPRCIPSALYGVQVARMIHQHTAQLLCGNREQMRPIVEIDCGRTAMRVSYSEYERQQHDTAIAVGIVSTVATCEVGQINS